MLWFVNSLQTGASYLLSNSIIMQSNTPLLTMDGMYNYQEKRRDYAYYKPVGPLEYLVMDSQGRSVLGLFEGKLTGELILMLKAWGGPWLLHVEKDLLEAYLEDRLQFEGLLEAATLTTLANKKAGLPWKALLKWWGSQTLGGFLSQPKKNNPYPNAFYLYREIKLFRGW